MVWEVWGSIFDDTLLSHYSLDRMYYFFENFAVRLEKMPTTPVFMSVMVSEMFNPYFDFHNPVLPQTMQRQPFNNH